MCVVQLLPESERLTARIAWADVRQEFRGLSRGRRGSERA